MHHQVTKTFSPDKGYSCCFRKFNADSHCRWMHGYDLRFSVTFDVDENHLNRQGWVVDFGGMGGIKGWLDQHFEHKLLVSEMDPELDEITHLAGLGIADVVVVADVGCEIFAAMFFNRCTEWLKDTGSFDRGVRVLSTTVSENGANAATVTP